MAQTMDHLTKGRVGFNIVTGLNPGGLADNLGAEVREHDARYERAEEFMEVCYALWQSWDSDALVRDKERSLFADPKKVREVNYNGKYFQCRGPSQLPRSPQEIPVLFKPVNLLEGDSLQLVMLRECLPLAQIYRQCNPITGMSKTD